MPVLIYLSVMLEMRLYVMYGNSKLVGLFLVSLLVGELLVWNLLRRSTFNKVVSKSHDSTTAAVQQVDS